MSKSYSLLVLAGLFTAFMCPAVRAQDKAAEEAKRAGAAFMKGLQTKDMKGLVEVTDVPWTSDYRNVVRDAGELKKQFQAIFDKEDFSALTHEVSQILPYRKVRDTLKEGDRKVLDEVVGEDGIFVVLKAMRKKGERKETWVIMVRNKGGKAKVVGLDVK